MRHTVHLTTMNKPRYRTSPWNSRCVWIIFSSVCFSVRRRQSLGQNDMCACVYLFTYIWHVSWFVTQHFWIMYIMSAYQVYLQHLKKITHYLWYLLTWKSDRIQLHSMFRDRQGLVIVIADIRCLTSSKTSASSTTYIDIDIVDDQFCQMSPRLSIIVLADHKKKS